MYPCTLLVSIIEDSDFEGGSYDFSLYQDEQIIGYTCYKKGKPYNGKFLDENGDPVVIPMKNQKVYLMKDGGYQWDFRQYM